MAKRTRKSSKSAAAPAGKTAATLDNVPFQDLAREMARRRRALDRLRARRDKLADQLRDLDAEITALGSTTGEPFEDGTRRRPRNEMSLADSLLNVLNGQVMSVTEAAEAVQEAGYKTSSSTFRTIVNQTLIKDPRFKKVARGQYTAK